MYGVNGGSYDDVGYERLTLVCVFKRNKQLDTILDIRFLRF